MYFFIQLCDLNLDMSISWARVCVNIYVVKNYVTISFFLLFSFLACTSILDVDGKLCCDSKMTYNFIYKISALVDKQLKRL